MQSEAAHGTAPKRRWYSAASSAAHCYKNQMKEGGSRADVGSAKRQTAGF
jgi:hypothetical protein